MQSPIPFFIVILIIIAASLYLNFIVWFRYSTYKNWIKKASNISKKANVPFSTFFSSFVKTSSYKWLVRLVLLFMLFMSVLPLAALILFFADGG